MRRFVQAFSGGSGIDGSLPAEVRAALAALPDRYNISIHGPAGIVFMHEQRWLVAEMAWGLVPSWEKEPSTRYSTQTARLERAPSSRLYRSAWSARRCLLPLTGYYKWDRESSPRQPYFIQAASGEVLFAAALWSHWGEPGAGLYSFSVLTHPNAAIPPPLVADGPRFVPPAQAQEWMLAPSARAASWLLRQAQPKLEAYAVSRRVANRKLDDYTLLEPVPAGEDFDAAFDAGDDDLHDDD